MAKLKWGVLGCASFARRRSIPAMLLAPSVELVGIASRTRQKAEMFQSQFGLRRAYVGYEEMLSDPDINAVHITLPNGLHHEWILHALANGKHVLCEKPITVSLSQAQEVSDACKRENLQVMEGFMWRYHPQHEHAISAIDNGMIGDVRLVRAAFTYQMQEPNIRTDVSLGGGSILDVGCYTISSVRYYFREEPRQVYANGETHPDHQIDMAVRAILDFPNGTALIDCGFNLPYRTDLEIVGTQGRIYFPRAWQPHEEATMVVNDQTIVLPPTNHYVNQFERFSQSILEEQPLPYGIDDAVRQMRTIDAIFRSLKSQRPEPVTSG